MLNKFLSFKSDEDDLLFSLEFEDELNSFLNKLYLCFYVFY